jgi:peptide/nickel transport system substrate-binding protein
MRAAAVSLLVALALVLHAGSEAREFRWAMQGDPATLDPHSISDTPSFHFLANIYEGLVTRDPELKIRPALARSWAWLDPLTVRFHLREARFHDGTPLEAGDIVYSLDRARKALAFASALAAVDTVTAQDDAIIIRLKRPEPGLLDALADVAIVSEHWARKAGFQAAAGPTAPAIAVANGTGPFQLESRAVGLRTTLVPNPAWWHGTEPPVTRVVAVSLVSDQTRVAALLSGDVDLIDAVPLHMAQQLRQQPGFAVQTRPGVLALFLGLNAGREEALSSPGARNPLRDKRVREAVRAAIDTDALASRIMFGLTAPTGSVVAPEVAGFRTGRTAGGTPEELARARSLLAEAGLVDGFEITLHCTNDRYPGDERICTALAPMLARIGVRARPTVGSKAQVMPLIYGAKSDFYLFGLSPFTLDGQVIAEALFGDPAKPGRGLLNSGAYRSERVEGLLDEAGAASERSAREIAIGGALTAALADVAAVPLFPVPVAWAFRTDVRLPQPATGRVHLERLSFAE